MSETTDDDQALERRNWNRLTAAVAVVVLSMLGIVVVQLVRTFCHTCHQVDGWGEFKSDGSDMPFAKYFVGLRL